MGFCLEKPLEQKVEDNRVAKKGLILSDIKSSDEGPFLF